MDEKELVKKFEEESGKNAIWRGKPTKGFKAWKKNPEAFRKIQVACPFCESTDLAVRYGGRIAHLGHLRGYIYIGCDLFAPEGWWYCHSCGKSFHFDAYPNAYCPACSAFLNRIHIRLEVIKEGEKIREIKFCKNCGNKLPSPFNPKE